MAHLVVRQAEADDPGVAVRDGQLRFLECDGERSGAVDGDECPDTHAAFTTVGASLFEQGLQHVGVAAELAPVQRRPHSGLDPHRAGGDGVVDRFAHQAPEVVVGAHHGAGRFVQQGELREAGVAGNRGDGDAVVRGQLLQRGHAHPALEVEVQVGFGEGLEIPSCRHRRLAAVSGANRGTIPASMALTIE